MKKILMTTALIGATFSVLAQGTIQMNGRSGTLVQAQVYTPNPGDPTLQVQGNTAANFPVGTQTYTGVLLTGSGFTAELWGGINGTAEGSLAPIAGSLTTFRTGATFSGFWASPGSVAIPGVLEGGIATLQVRAWDNLGGTVLTWAQALTLSAHGVSAVFQSTALGGIGAPPVLENVRSFNLTSTVPEPGTLALAGLGAASMLLFRRKK